MKTQKRVYDILQIGQREDIISHMFDIFIVIIIFLNIAVLFLSTFDEMAPYAGILHQIEIFTIIIFCIEYALRIWTAPYLYPAETPLRARLHFLYSFDGVVDLLTILPFFFLTGFAVFRILRVVRIFHLFRINASYDSFNVITSVLAEKFNQIMSSIFIIIILMLAASLTMYSVEHNAQPEAFKNAFSGIWWSLTTIFTVGYGDIYPITFTGRVIAVFITFLGVGVVAIPTGIISAGFVEHYTRLQQSAIDTNRKSTVTAYVEENTDFAHKNVHDIEAQFHINISAIIRKDSVIVPADHVEIMPGDTIVYTFN